MRAIGFYTTFACRHSLCVGPTIVGFAGQSNSSYSLANQQRLNPNLFDADPAVAERQLTDIIDKLEKQYGVLSLTDVVWNHTAVCWDI